MSDPTPNTPATTQRSPFAGCIIMIAIAAVALFVIGMAIFSLIRQNQEIDKFTEAQKKEITLPAIEGNEASLNALHERMQAFRNDLLAKPDQTHTLALSKEDLNFLLASAPILKDLAAQCSVTELRGGRIIAEYSRALNGMPGSNALRYLNAQATFRPSFAEKSLSLKIESLAGTKSPVADEFIAQIPPYRIGLDHQNDPVFGPVLAQLTACEVIGDQLILRRIPGELTVLTVDDRTVKSSFMRILRVLVIGFLIVAAIGIFFALRASAKRRSAEGKPSA
jgi:hypothetical protein